MWSSTTVTSEVPTYDVYGINYYKDYMHAASYSTCNVARSVRKLQRNKYLSYFLRPMGISLKKVAAIGYTRN